MEDPVQGAQGSICGQSDMKVNYLEDPNGDSTVSTETTNVFCTINGLPANYGQFHCGQINQKLHMCSIF